MFKRLLTLLATRSGAKMKDRNEPACWPTDENDYVFMAGDTVIGEEILARLLSFERTKTVAMTDCEISCEVGKLKDLPNLGYITFAGSKFRKEIDLCSLFELPQLRVLCVYGCGLSKSTIATLRETSGDCRVFATDSDYEDEPRSTL